MKPSIGIAVLTYAHPLWLLDMLYTMQKFGWPDCPVRVFSDGPAFNYVEDRHTVYRDVCKQFEVPIQFLPQWGCIQANAQQAFENTPEDWVICLQDDNLMVDGFLQHCFQMIYDYHDHPAQPGMFQPPFWHAHELAEHVEEEPSMMRSILLESPNLLKTMIHNPGWRKKTETGEPCTYINAHGSGMIVRRKVWEMVGGFSPHTWRYDEELSGRCWFETPYSIFQFDGPPMVHGCPGVTNARPQPMHRYSSDRNFVKATGKTPHEWGLLGRKAMELAGGDAVPISKSLRRERGLLK